MRSTQSYQRGKLPAALLAAARQIMDESGLESVGLREASRRVGVSATAAYRHFASKEDLLASLAAEGFRELAAAMESATGAANFLTRVGVAYIEFAHQNPGLFRLMFGPLLVNRAKYPPLLAATLHVEALLLRGVASADQQPLDDNLAAMAAWGLAHGISHLIVDGFFSPARATDQAEEILAKIRLPRRPISESVQ
jgi:AcrR family transcriptional regulator